MHHSSHFNAFFPVKINKMWNFCLKLWFFMNHLLYRLKTCAIGFGMHSNPKYVPLKPFQMHFSQSKSTKCEILALCLTPPDKKWKKTSIWTGKKCWKGLKICTYRFWGMPIAMHYVRTLCDKYFLSNDGFSWFLTGRFRHRVLKHGVRVEWDARRTVA